MSSTRLLVLGVVRIFQPVHGYDVRRELLTWWAEEWANVNPGSIYHALKKATRDGLVRVVGTEVHGSRPERTAYELTPDGDQEFFALLRDALWRVTGSPSSVYAGIAFLTALRRDEALALLRSRSRSSRPGGRACGSSTPPTCTPGTPNCSSSSPPRARARPSGPVGSSTGSRRVPTPSPARCGTTVD